MMNQNVTEIIFLLDRSGSMEGLENDTIGGFNAFVRKQCQLEGETLLTTVLFDHEYEILWNGIEANKVQLTNKKYFVRGTTALLDAIGRTILDVGTRLKNTNEQSRPGKVLFVITTDGMENASSEFTYQKVRELIEHQTKKYNWEFIFLGANIDSTEEAINIGIAKENAYDFEASSDGVEKMYCMLSDVLFEKRS